MAITAVEAARVRIAHLDSVGRLFRAISSGGSATSAAAILDYQRGWNSRWRQLQEAMALQGQHALANTLRELAEDGRWGSNTAYTTAVWISAEPPPSTLSGFRTWWSRNGATIRDRVDAIYRLDRALIDSAERTVAPPAPPMLPPITEATTPGITDPTTTIEEDAERAGITSSGSRSARGGSSGGGMIVGLAVILGLGAMYYYQQKSRGMGVLDFNGIEGEDCGCDG